MSLNKVMLIGNVGKDPEVRYLETNQNQTSTQTRVATFSLATTERYRDRNGELRENTEWHNIVAWRSLAELVEKYVKKGTQLYVEGSLRTRSWTDQNQNTRYTTEILADKIQLLGKKSDNPASTGGYVSPNPAGVTTKTSTPAVTPQDVQASQNIHSAQSDTVIPEPSEPDGDLPF